MVPELVSDNVFAPDSQKSLLCNLVDEMVDR